MEILPKRISLLNKISIKSTLKLKLHGCLSGKMRIYKNSVCEFGKECQINVESGLFEINKKWTQKDPFPFLFSLKNNATVIVKGPFRLYAGSRVYINEKATLIRGSGYINNDLNLSCFERIVIGKNVAISERVTIRDSDNHEILGLSHIKTKPVFIDDDVWIGMNVTILKGVNIGRGSVIAAGSLVNKDIPPFSLAAGVPAKVIRSDVKWK